MVSDCSLKTAHRINKSENNVFVELNEIARNECSSRQKNVS
jgi:hypothetical protein